MNIDGIGSSPSLAANLTWLPYAGAIGAIVRDPEPRLGDPAAVVDRCREPN
jgi:hypothetical protein